MLAYNKHASMINNENSTKQQGGKKASKAALPTKRVSRPLANITNITTRERNTNKGKKVSSPHLISSKLFHNMCELAFFLPSFFKKKKKNSHLISQFR